MKSLLFLIMIFAVISCNDNPVIVQEPTSDNIFFTPDTIKITESYQDIKVIFKGVDFLENKIDSIFINDIPLENILRYKDSMITYITKMVTGTFDVYLYYNGKKVTLNKKLVIINPYLDFEISKFSKFSLEFSNIPIRDYNYSLTTYAGEGKPSITYIDNSYSDIIGSTQFSIPTMINILTYQYNFKKIGYYDYNYLYIEFSSKKNIITKLEYNYSYSYDYDYLYNWTKIKKYKIENIPYKLTTNQTGNVELLIDIQGKEIDKYYPLIYIQNIMKQIIQGNNQSNSKEYFITKKDSLTGKEINYYPVNDSSRIKFVLY